MKALVLALLVVGCLIAGNWTADCDIASGGNTGGNPTAKPAGGNAGGNSTEKPAGGNAGGNSTENPAGGNAGGNSTENPDGGNAGANSTAKSGGGNAGGNGGPTRRRRQAGACSAYDTSASNTDKDCSALKKYIGCTFGQDSASPCDIPAAHQTEIGKKDCKGNEPVGVCKCELDYYKADLSTDICTTLTTLDTCVNATKTDPGCGSETKTQVQSFVASRKKANKCGSGGNIVAVAPGLLMSLLLATIYL